MKIPVRIHYAIMAMAYLLQKNNGEPHSITSIAASTGISEKYLENIFSILRRDKLVKSVKGKRGGYFVESDGSDVTIWDIYRAFESAFIWNENEMSAFPDFWVWKELEKSAQTVLDSITLRQIIERSNKHVFNYTI